jgi:transposase-like protein
MTSIVAVYRRWPTKADCINHLETVRWGDKPTCAYCGAERVSRNRDASREATAERWKCQRCLRSFSVTVGTIFHNTHVDLQRWFLLISLMMSAKKGLSAMQAARDLEMRRPTVWSMMHRIRKAMIDDGELLSGLVEMDEAFIGGKPRKGTHKDMDDDGPRDPGAKSPVVGAVARRGKVKAKVLKRDELTATVFRALVHDWMILKQTVLTTDELPSYRNLGDIIPHRTINHSRAYSQRDESFDRGFGVTHTNTIEAFWSIVRRAIIGQFHHVSQKYLPLYMREICYRYNDRIDQLRVGWRA